MAALDCGMLRRPTTIINDTGEFDPRRRSSRSRTPGMRATARSSSAQALKVSSDVFFYTLGASLNAGRRGDAPGQVGTRAGVRPADRPRPAGRGSTGLPADTPGLARPSCSRRAKHRPPWTSGDNVNLAIGQGDLQADPLQMAVAYATIANGGDLVRPHVGLRARGPERQRRSRRSIPRPERHVDIDPTYRADDHGWACTTPRRSHRGTSYAVFGDFPVHDRGQDRDRRARPASSTSPGTCPWRRTTNPKIVVAVTIEQGGLRCRLGRPGGPADPRGPLLRHPEQARGPAAGAEGRPDPGGGLRALRLMASDADPRPLEAREGGPLRRRARAARAWTRCCWSPRSG